MIPAVAPQEDSGVSIEKNRVVMRKGGFGHMNLLEGEGIGFHIRFPFYNRIAKLSRKCERLSKDRLLNVTV